MREKTSNFARRLFSLFLVIAVLLPTIDIGIVTTVDAKVTQGQIDDLEDEAAQLAAERKELEAQLDAVSNDKNKALEQKTLLEQQIAVIQSEIDNISGQISRYAELITVKEEEIAISELEEQKQYDLFCERVRIMEEEGEVSYLSVLFSAADFSDLLDRFIMVEEIMEYDNAVMDELTAIREKLVVDRAELETSKQEQERAKAKQVEAKKELKVREDKIDATIRTILATESELEKAEKNLDQASAAMDREIAEKERQLEAQLAAEGGSIVSEAGFVWPLASNYNVLSSLAGGRIHPITGKASTHGGIDVPAGGGKNIYAAKSGVVLTNKYNRSYGNYIVISHGNGQSTLYAHMRSRGIVKEGTTVKQGQVIGYVGTTGSSTGNHLHFEIRENGKKKDPVKYYQIPLYVRSGGVTKRLN